MNVHRVFPITEKFELKTHVLEIDGKSHIKMNDNCLIVGHKETCKTSLLFQAALTYATEGEQVMFICPQPFGHRPLTVKKMTLPSPLYSQHIKFVYISDPKEFIKFLSHLHLTGNLPIAILVDDIQYYAHGLKENGNMDCVLAKLCAVLQDTVGFLSRKRGNVCHLWVTMMKSMQGSSAISACYRYFSDIWHCSIDTSQLCHADSYILSLPRCTISNLNFPTMCIYFHKEQETLIFDRIS